MYQDQQGYIWSGGYGGLSRFDGKVFLNYNRRDGLIDHNVNAITCDLKGTIFVGTNKGLSMLKNKKISSIPEFPGRYKNPVITSLCRGAQHSVYIGTPRGLYIWKNHLIQPVQGLKNHHINFLFRPDTTVVFVASNEGLVVLGEDSVYTITQANGLPSNRVNALSLFKNSLVIGTSSGLSFLDLRTRKISTYQLEHGLIDENISYLQNQDNRFLWVGSQSGLLRFDGRTFDYYNVAADNNSNQIRCILRDREDNIWLGTHSGLYRYRDNSFSTFDKESGLGSAFIFQIFRDRKNSLWVTSQNNGVYRSDGNLFKRYNQNDGLTSNTSRAALEDSEGRLLFGTNENLVRFSDGRFSPVPLPDSLKAPFDVLYEATDKTLWLGGTNGIGAIRWKNNKAIPRFYRIESKSDFAVYGFCEDDSTNLYIGTFKAGLRMLQGDSIVDLSSRHQLNEETFFTLRYINGHIFAASLNGVLVYNTRTHAIRKISDADGLNSELVYSLEITRDQNFLWIGTNQGINRLNLKSYFESGRVEITSFGKQEGFAGVECNSNGIWEDDDGTLWFGTVSGLIKHQPFNYKKNTTENSTVIQNIRLMNEDTLLADSARLPYDINTIAFYYRGICLTNPDRVLYQCKLEGLKDDQDWGLPTTENYIKYTNLAPGRYTFRIRSCNNEGIWNTSPTSFSFVIASPFYMTWWFILLVAVFLFSLIYAVFIFRIYNIKKKQRKDFERKVEMSKIELKALRSQMNPHFVFNSLNAIQHYIFKAKSEEAIKSLNKFARLVRIILNNSEKSTVTVGEDIEALKLYLELEQMRFEEKFEYEVIIDESVDPDYDIMPPLLMQPYVENAILHGLNPRPQKGKLTIRLHSKNNFLICTITDDGIGRQKSAEIRRTMPYRKHKSLGMKITEDRLRILNDINNSQLSVTITDLKDDNDKPLGTRVELFVPLSG